MKEKRVLGYLGLGWQANGFVPFCSGTHRLWPGVATPLSFGEKEEGEAIDQAAGPAPLPAARPQVLLGFLLFGCDHL